MLFLLFVLKYIGYNVASFSVFILYLCFAWFVSAQLFEYRLLRSLFGRPLFTSLSIETISLFIAVLSYKVATNTDLVNTESLFLGEIQS